jgi:hypothetical protein
MQQFKLAHRFNASQQIWGLYKMKNGSPCTFWPNKTTPYYLGRQHLSPELAPLKSRNANKQGK